MYNPVRCPVTMALKAMPKESVESMHGYCRGLTGMLGKAAAAKVLAQVFAVQSVEWVMTAQVSPLGSIEHSMVEGYKETVQVLCLHACMHMSRISAPWMVASSHMCGVSNHCM